MNPAQNAWPWQRVTSDRRPLFTLAVVLISISGFVSGIALRPLTQSATSPELPGQSVVTSKPTATPTYTAIPLTPQLFALSQTITPREVSAGESVTVTIHAKTNPGDETTPIASVAGITCVANLVQGKTVIPLETMNHVTDADGNATWTVVIPATIPPGAYTFQVSGKWSGNFAATSETDFTVGS